jgi:hypothetical protein
VDVEVLERDGGEAAALEPPQEGNRRTLALDREELEERPELRLTQRGRDGRRRRPGRPKGGFEEGGIQHGRRSR